MPKYVSFFAYETQATRKLIESPQDRAAPVRKLVESQGGRMECFYWMFGPHDGLVIAEYPDAGSAAAAAAAVCASGNLRRFETYPLIDGDAIPGILKKAQTTVGSYKPL